MQQQICLHIFKNRWGILFSHPKDYTPVCTTELGRVVELYGEFVKRGLKMIALSCDSVKDHRSWAEVCRFYRSGTDFHLFIQL